MKPVRVVLDAMGGDFAPKNEVQGAVAAVRTLGSRLQLTLVGREADLKAELAAFPESGAITIVHADDVVSMDDEPSSIVKQRQSSSLYIGVERMRSGAADAFVSAGNTGGVMATSTMLCGRIAGVSRPTIGSFLPTKTGRPCLVVDVGANVDSKARFLHDFAVMGSVYYRLMMGVERPSVGLLNVGEEPTKGREVVREAHGLLASANINFVGNVEGRDILSGNVDVVVCDGFEGNIVLKFAESVLGFLKEKLRRYAAGGLVQKLAMAVVAPVLRSALRDMDYQEYGGVPLLGINGVTIIGHGSSSPKAIANMIARAVDVVDRDVNGAISAAITAPLKKETP